MQNTPPSNYALFAAAISSLEVPPATLIPKPRLTMNEISDLLGEAIELVDSIEGLRNGSFTEHLHGTEESTMSSGHYDSFSYSEVNDSSKQ